MGKHVIGATIISNSPGYDPVEYGQMLFEDFVSVDPSSSNFILKDLNKLLLSSGTISTMLLDENQMNVFGVARISSSVMVNSGVLLSSYVGNKILRGGEVFKTSIRFASVSNDVVARFGFIGNTDWSQTIVGKTVRAGVYFDLVNGVVSGNIVLGISNISITTRTFTPFTTPGKYYHLEINTSWNGNSTTSSGTDDDFFATFKIYDGETLVFNETISKNYYHYSYGYQLVGSAIVAQSTGITAKELIRLDYIQQYSIKKFIR